MTVYISGPMSGIPDLNREAFATTAEILRERGHSVINPHDLSPERLPDESDCDFYERCMQADLAALATCDSIQLLPGWEASKGACRELLRALELGKKVMH